MKFHPESSPHEGFSIWAQKNLASKAPIFLTAGSGVFLIWGQKAWFLKTARNTIFKHEIPPRIKSPRGFCNLGSKKIWPPKHSFFWPRGQEFSSSGLKKLDFLKQQEIPFLSMKFHPESIPLKGFSIWAQKKFGLQSSHFSDRGVRSFPPLGWKSLIFKNSKKYHV